MKKLVLAAAIAICSLLVPARAQNPDGTIAPKGGAIGAFIASMPRIAEIYRRKMMSVAEETGRDPSTLEKTPTMLAVRGLAALRAGDEAGARAAASALLEQKEERKGGAFFPFRFDYSGPWPYRLEAPWVSALSQGLALALFDQLSARGEAGFAAAAHATALSFAVPLEAGGFARMEADTAFFEEYPLAVPTRVLNGGLIATLALSDFLARQPDARLQPVLDGAFRWWRQNAGAYTAISPDWPMAVSAYSLAPSRAEVLFRFIGGSNAEISRLSLQPAGGEASIIEAGGNADDRTDHDGFLWINPQFQNWGERQSSPVRARTIVNGQGRYGHAPFSLVMKESDPAKPVTLGITGRATGPEKLAVQVFDGQEYHALGMLERSGQARDYTFDLPPAAVANLVKARMRRGPPIQSSYFYDNARLMQLLVQRIGDADLVRLAALWMSAASLVPGWTDARALPSALAGDPAPVLAPKAGTSESAEVAHPTVVRHGGQLQMIYAALGGDKRWRLLLATSADEGKSWTRQGGIFDEAKAPFRSVSYPQLVHDEKNGRFLLYFSAATQPDGDFESIQLAESKDLFSWRHHGVVVPRGGRAPAIWREEGRLVMLYSLPAGGNLQSLLEQTSVDGLVWSGPRVVHAALTPERAGALTQSALKVEDRPVLIADHQPTRERQELVLLCRTSDGSYVQPLADPLHVVDIRQTVWDQRRAGLSALPIDGGLVAFYTGLRLDPAGQSGGIGRGRLAFSDGQRQTIRERCRR